MNRLILLILTLIFVAPMSMAQQVGVPFNGLVVDGQGKGIGRMRVEVKGTDKRTVSDKMGRFGLTDPPMTQYWCSVVRVPRWR